MAPSKTHICNRCAQEFDDIKLLRVHRQQHGVVVNGSSSTRLRPTTSQDHRYPCPHCRQKFQKQQGLTRHLQNKKTTCHSLEAATKSSTAPSITQSSRSRHVPGSICPYCGLDFKKNSSLSKHLSTHTVCQQRHQEAIAEPISSSRSQTPASLHSVAMDAPDLEPEIDRLSLISDRPGSEQDNVPQAVQPELVTGWERAPDGDYKVYVEKYPVPTVGKPIRRATAEELNETAYPDVGQLADPECFEIAHALMQSGMSGVSRERFFRLKRVSRTICCCMNVTYISVAQRKNAVETKSPVFARCRHATSWSRLAG
jgi:hypothetical protein